MRINFSFANQSFGVKLYANPTARDLLTKLPFDLEIEDYSTNEKIAYLPQKLIEHQAGRFPDPAVGDLCYYVPWGSLAFYHGPYGYSAGLIRVGTVIGGIEPLLTRGRYPLRAEVLT